MIEKLNQLQRERAGLGITAKDLNESDDPLDNILRDVMCESFYKRINKNHPIPEK